MSVATSGGYNTLRLPKGSIASDASELLQKMNTQTFTSFPKRINASQFQPKKSTKREITSQEMIKALKNIPHQMPLHSILHGVDEYKYSLLWYAAVRFHDIAKVQFILNAGANVDMPIEAKSTVFMCVIYNGYLDIADVLIKHGANINHTNANGHCALTMAIRSGSEKTIDYLIHRTDIDLAIRDIFEKYPIQYFHIDSTNTHRNVLAHALLEGANNKKKYSDALDAYVASAGLEYIKQTDKSLYNAYINLRLPSQGPSEGQ